MTVGRVAPVAPVAPRRRTRTVSVFAVCVAPAELGPALATFTEDEAQAVVWRVYSGHSKVRGGVDIVVCPFTLSRSSFRMFPGAMLVAIAPGPQSFDTVARAYADGASVFVEELDVSAVAAATVAAARRGGVLEHSPSLTWLP